MAQCGMKRRSSLRNIHPPFPTVAVRGKKYENPATPQSGVTDGINTTFVGYSFSENSIIDILRKKIISTRQPKTCP